MCIVNGCVVTGESKLCSVSVITEGELVQGIVSYIVYVFRHWVRWYRGE